MEGPSAVRKPCCVCDGPGGQHCTKCKSRHYCGKACQLVDWKEGGHKEQCKQMADDFQDRLLDALMPEKLKIKEAPAIVDDVAPAAGLQVAARLSAVRAQTTAVVKATAVHDAAPDWRGTCAVCLDRLPLGNGTQRFYECCCKNICAPCSKKCREYDTRCPLCRTPAAASNAEFLRRLQKHVDEGHAEAQYQLGNDYNAGSMGLKQNFKRGFQLHELAAAQGHAPAQNILGQCFIVGRGVKIDYTAAAHWCRRAADQGYPDSQFHLGTMFCNGEGVAQSDDEAARWYRLAGAQGHPDALYMLAGRYESGFGVPQDFYEALRCFKRAAAAGHVKAAAEVEHLSALLASQ